MKNTEIARGYLGDAKIIFDEAKESLAKKHYHRTVRKCQEASELALKGLLRFLGVEYPKSHRLGKILLDSNLKYEIDSDTLGKLADISDQLAIDREISFYGSEEELAVNLFERDDAKEALQSAGFVVSPVERIFKDKGV